MNQEPIAPHPPLPAYYEGPAGKQPFVRRIFDETAHWYDSIESLLSLKSGSMYRRQALERAGLQSGMRMLDVASGTGVVARAAISIIPARDIVGLDPSIGMLLAGRQKTRLPITQAGAEQLPFRAESFNFAAIGFALRHFADLRSSFEELHRVMKPGGKLLILEITPPRSRVARNALGFYMGRVVPLLAGVISRRRDAKTLMQYYWDTVQTCVPPETILAAMKDVGFTSVERHVELGIFSEYSGVRQR